LMSRQAADTMWITVEDAQGQMTRMGVTSEHPLFVIDEGSLDASQVAPGDQIRNSNLQALTVLSISLDTTPSIVPFSWKCRTSFEFCRNCTAFDACAKNLNVEMPSQKIGKAEFVQWCRL
ncbi:MAG: hypothetical protein ABJ249_06335, partial [Lentilitoribacter sp.]